MARSKVLRGWLLSTCAILAAMPGSAHAGNSYIWKAPGGGDYNDPQNWNRGTGTTEDPPPKPGDDVLFAVPPGDSSGAYTVNLSGVMANFVQTNDSVTFNMSGNFSLATLINANADHFVGTGTLSADTITAQAAITIAGGIDLTARGADLDLKSLGGHEITTEGGDVTASGTLTLEYGVLDVTNGTTITSQTGVLIGGGNNNDGPLTSTLEAGTKWTIAGTLFAENSGYVTVKSGAELTAAALTFTTDDTFHSSQGGLVVDGGSATIAGHIDGNGGNISFKDNGTLTSGDIVTSNGMTITGDNATWVNQGSFILGASGEDDQMTLTNNAHLSIDGNFTIDQEGASGGFLSLGSGATMSDNTAIVSEGGNSGPNPGTSYNSIVFVDGPGTTWMNKGDLTVGGAGTALISITGSGGALATPTSVIDQNGVVGLMSTGSTMASEVQVSGVGAEWINRQTLTVGKGGEGSLNLDSGGQVSSGDAIVGDLKTGDGEASLVGAGSLWKVNGDLTVGKAGTGEATVDTKAALIVTKSLTIGDTGTGAVTVQGGGALTVSGPTLALGVAQSGTGTLTLQDVGTKFDFKGAIQIGVAGKGTLDIAKGFVLDTGTQALTLGGQKTATGRLQIFNAGTKYAGGELKVGDEGLGVVSVESGGTLSTTTTDIGVSKGSVGSVFIEDDKSTWDLNGDLTIGDAGTGSVTIENDGALMLAKGRTITLGAQIGSSGTFTLDGPGAIVTPSTAIQTMIIGFGGKGTLALMDGAQLTLHPITLGELSSSTGVIEVSGDAGDQASSLTISDGALEVGSLGNGQVMVEDGGKVTLSDTKDTNGLIIGALNKDRSGTVTVSGASSIFDASATTDAIIGGANEGSGALTVTAGKAMLHHILLGENTTTSGGGGTGTVTVSDKGTLTADSIDLSKGGTLNVKSGATVTLNAAKHENDLRLTAFGAVLNVDGAGSKLTTSSATADTTFNIDVSDSGAINVTNRGAIKTSRMRVLLGNVTVDGTGSSLTADGQQDTSAAIVAGALRSQNGAIVNVGGMDVGFDAAGQETGVAFVDVTNGAEMTATKDVRLTGGSGGEGFMVIDGGKFTTLGTLTDGYENDGSLSVDHNGELTAKGLGVGLYSGQVASSARINNDSLVMVKSLTVLNGEMDVENGSTVNTDSVVLGGLSDGSTLKVESGSIVAITGDLHVDGHSNTLLKVDGGKLSAGSINIDGSKAIVDLTDAQVNAKTMLVAGGLVQFNDSVVMQIDTQLQVAGGNFNVLGGTANIGSGSNLQRGSLRVGAGGTFIGDQILGDLINDGGRINAGNVQYPMPPIDPMAREAMRSIAPASAADADALPGTMTVTGDYEQNLGGTLVIAANPTAAAELVVTGHAGLAGTLEINAENATYQPHTDYTILTAGNGIDGTFGKVESDLAFLTPSLTYTADAVTLDLALKTTTPTGPSVMFTSVAQTMNQIDVATTLDAAAQSGAIYSGLITQSAPGARQAFDLLSGEIYASTQTVLLDDSRFVRDAILDHLGFTDSETESSSVFWGQGLGSWGHFDGDGNAARVGQSTGGLLGGIDFSASGWHFGGFGGYTYSRLSVHDRDSSAKADSGHVGLYAGTLAGDVSFKAGAAYTWNTITVDRTIAFGNFDDALHGDYDAHTMQAFGELGYDFHLDGATIQPFGNLAYVKIHSDDVAEQGGFARLTVEGEDKAVTLSTFGVHMNGTFSLAGMDASANATFGWRHVYGGIVPLLDAALPGDDSFEIAGIPIARDAAIIDAGLVLNLSANSQLSLSYSGELSGRTRDNGVQATVTFAF